MQPLKQLKSPVFHIFYLQNAKFVHILFSAEQLASSKFTEAKNRVDDTSPHDVLQEIKFFFKSAAEHF